MTRHHRDPHAEEFLYAANRVTFFFSVLIRVKLNYQIDNRFPYPYSSSYRFPADSEPTMIQCNKNKIKNQFDHEIIS